MPFPRQSQWPCRLRRGSSAARLLRLWVRIPPGAWMFMSVVCCQVAVVCDELITRPEESYLLWCVMCELETSRMRRPWPALGRSAIENAFSSLFRSFSEQVFSWTMYVCHSVTQSGTVWHRVAQCVTSPPPPKKKLPGFKCPEIIQG